MSKPYPIQRRAEAGCSALQNGKVNLSTCAMQESTIKANVLLPSARLFKVFGPAIRQSVQIFSSWALAETLLVYNLGAFAGCKLSYVILLHDQGLAVSIWLLVYFSSICLSPNFAPYLSCRSFQHGVDPHPMHQVFT
ncbi:hypothetical protein FB446DRAFT_346456 [Lentinula raphanica]|nr:hypothetical protein FB446DRAFT_346456 [Lentinula raphanica]